MQSTSLGDLELRGNFQVQPLWSEVTIFADCQLISPTFKSANQTWAKTTAKLILSNFALRALCYLTKLQQRNSGKTLPIYCWTWRKLGLSNIFQRFTEFRLRKRSCCRWKLQVLLKARSFTYGPLFARTLHALRSALSEEWQLDVTHQISHRRMDLSIMEVTVNTMYIWNTVPGPRLFSSVILM